MDGSCSPSHIPGSMVLVYMLTWLGYIDGIHVTIYSIHGSYGIWQIISFDLSPLCDILLYLWGERWDSVPTSNKAYTEHWDLYRSSFFNALRELFLGGPVGPGQFWWRVSASVCENICCKFAGFSCLRIMAFLLCHVTSIISCLSFLSAINKPIDPASQTINNPKASESYPIHLKYWNGIFFKH